MTLIIHYKYIAKSLLLRPADKDNLNIANLVSDIMAESLLFKIMNLTTAF
jgi:hypothetical protein